MGQERLRIDKEKGQVVMDLPKQKLSVPQRLVVSKLIREQKVGALTNYLQTFFHKSEKPAYAGHKPRRAPHGNPEIDELKHHTTGKNLDRDRLRDTVPGNILSQYYERCDVMADDLRPISLSEKYPAGLAVGVEIECYLPITRDEVREQISLAPIPNVRCGTDSSIVCDSRSSNYFTMEFRVLTNIRNMQNLQKLCGFLKDNGARVNKSCGMHIHLDFRNAESLPSGAVERLLAILPVLKLMVPQSRLDNQYCEGDVSLRGRRAKINTLSFDKHKTIEVRLHTGTANYQKISEWIKICHAAAFGDFNGKELAEKLRGILSFSEKVEEVARVLKLEDFTRDYILHRIKKFNPEMLQAPEEKLVAAAEHDDELEAVPPVLVQAREEERRKKDEIYRGWHVWINGSRSKHAEAMRKVMESVSNIGQMPAPFLKKELERQLQIREGDMAEKTFNTFYQTFYMFDKKKKPFSRTIPYLAMYFDKFPQLKAEVMATAKKRGAEESAASASLQEQSYGSYQHSWVLPSSVPVEMPQMSRQTTESMRQLYESVATTGWQALAAGAITPRRGSEQLRGVNPFPPPPYPPPPESAPAPTPVLATCQVCDTEDRSPEPQAEGNNQCRCGSGCCVDCCESCDVPAPSLGAVMVRRQQQIARSIASSTQPRAITAAEVMARSRRTGRSGIDQLIIDELNDGDIEIE